MTRLYSNQWYVDVGTYVGATNNSNANAVVVNVPCATALTWTTIPSID